MKPTLTKPQAMQLAAALLGYVTGTLAFKNDPGMTEAQAQDLGNTLVYGGSTDRDLAVFRLLPFMCYTLPENGRDRRCYLRALHAIGAVDQVFETADGLAAWCERQSLGRRESRVWAQVRDLMNPEPKDDRVFGEWGPGKLQGLVNLNPYVGALPRMCTHRFFVDSRSNHYVLVQNANGDWKDRSGRGVSLMSVHSTGEVRWTILRWQVEYGQRCEIKGIIPTGDTAMNLAAARYFGLIGQALSQEDLTTLLDSGDWTRELYGEFLRGPGVNGWQVDPRTTEGLQTLQQAAALLREAKKQDFLFPDKVSAQALTLVQGLSLETALAAQDPEMQSLPPAHMPNFRCTVGDIAPTPGRVAGPLKDYQRCTIESLGVCICQSDPKAHEPPAEQAQEDEEEPPPTWPRYPRVTVPAFPVITEKTPDLDFSQDPAPEPAGIVLIGAPIPARVALVCTLCAGTGYVTNVDNEGIKGTPCPCKGGDPAPVRARVTLLRGPLGPKVYEHGNNLAQARNRADTLADLHGSKVQETPEGLIVDASDWYTNQKR